MSLQTCPRPKPKMVHLVNFLSDKLILELVDWWQSCQSLVCTVRTMRYNGIQNYRKKDKNVINIFNFISFIHFISYDKRGLENVIMLNQTLLTINKEFNFYFYSLPNFCDYYHRSSKYCNLRTTTNNKSALIAKSNFMELIPN